MKVVTIGIESIAVDICKTLVRQGKNFRVTREPAGSVADGVTHLRDHWRFEVYDEGEPTTTPRHAPEWGGPE